MAVIKTLSEYIISKQEIEDSVTGINCHLINTFRHCCRSCFEDIAPAEELGLKIDSVIDYLHDELHTGHWSSVALSIKRGFTAATFVKTIIVLKFDTSVNSLSEALKCLDRGILLGAPLEKNCDLLTKSAKYLAKELAGESSKINKGNIETEKGDAEANGSTEVIKMEKRKKHSSYTEYDYIEAVEIDQKSMPSLEHFLKFYLLPQKPVIIEDCMTHWPACKKWIDVNYLLKVAGERTVPIEIGSQYSDENWSQKLMTFKEFIEKYYLEKNEDIGYLAQHNLLDQIPELKDDICIPDYCCLSRDFSEPMCSPEINTWFGPKGTVSSLHYDPKDNILAQIFGVKQVFMFSPSDTEYLYPHDCPLLTNTSQVDPTKPDLEIYPRYKEAVMYKCLLKDGDMLYIPPNWWHHITALKKSFSVNFWWT